MFVNLVNMLFFRVGFFLFFLVLLGMEIFQVNVAAATTIATAITITSTTIAISITASTTTVSITAFFLF